MVERWMVMPDQVTARRVVADWSSLSRPVLTHASGNPALTEDRAQDIAVSLVRTMGAHYRQLSRVFSTAGLGLRLPFFDDRVIETALAVRPHERSTPRQYKPLLVDAMRPVLPEVIAARTTKGNSGKMSVLGSSASARDRGGLRRFRPGHPRHDRFGPAAP